MIGRIMTDSKMTRSALKRFVPTLDGWLVSLNEPLATTSPDSFMSVMEVTVSRSR